MMNMKLIHHFHYLTKTQTTNLSKQPPPPPHTKTKTNMSLAGKNIIITGATSGLGVDMASALSGAGARVFIGGRRSDLGEAVAHTTQTTFHVVDVADEESNRAFFKAAADHFGAAAVDYIFLNAGVEGNGSEMVAGTDAFTVQSFDQVFGVNVRGIVFGLQFGTPLLRPHGSFVWTSSGASIFPLPQAPFYAASKSTVDALARNFAVQFAQSPDERLRTLSVLTINPLVYETDMSGRFTGGNDEMLQHFATAMNPSQRVGQGSELGQLMVDYARGALPYKNGDSFVVDADTHFPLSEYHDRMSKVSARQEQEAAAATKTMTTTDTKIEL
jgi:NAD(P)-dependent dehydrogenase (short-subunit alcohol dehydrogenase family)